MLAEALAQLGQGRSLRRDQARQVMGTILRGQATEAQIAALLTALHSKGETVDELVGFAEAMRAHARPIFSSADQRPSPLAPPLAGLVDTCGTGGDNAGTFNVSTATALVAAGAGARVAKHGNRSISSKCGSADVLEALGVNIALEPERIGAAIAEVGIGFIFAPTVHTAMKHAQAVRRRLRHRTVFNLLGPLTNPAGVEAQVVGVFDSRWLEPMAQALGELGVRRAFVLHSRDGLDEASLSDVTDFVELRDRKTRRGEFNPKDFSLSRAPREALAGGDAQTNAKIIERILAGEPGPPRDVVLLNTSLTLVAAGVAADFRAGIERAAQAIDSGAARDRLRALVEFSNRL